MIKAIGLVKYANGVTVTKTLREVTGLSLYECKETSDTLRVLRGTKGAWIEIVPYQGPPQHSMPSDYAVGLLIKAGIILLVDGVAVPPVPEIDLLRQEMQSQIERMAVLLDGVVSWHNKEEAE